MKQVILFFMSLMLIVGICTTEAAAVGGNGAGKSTAGESAALEQGEESGAADESAQEGGKGGQVQKKDELGLYAQSAVLMDAKTGRVLYGKNEELARPMASTTKIMTCILALEYGTLSDTVTASQNAAAQPKVHLGVYKGETFRLEDLLYSLMLESHNDAAVMIAEHVGGSVEGFAAMMNQKARDLGCTDTYFITPNGLDATREVNGEMREHSTSAADLARIMNYCIGTSPKKEEFLKITGTQSCFFTDLEGRRSYSCVNHNALLTMMSGVISGKTGFTGGAGYSYVGALKDGDREFTIALLGCGWPPHKTYKWSDARKLFDYGKANYQYREVYEEEVLPKLPVVDGIPASGDLGEQVAVSLSLNLKEEEKSLKLLLAEGEEVTVSRELPERLLAPVRKGQTVGTVTYRLNGEAVKTFPVYLTEGVEKISFRWCLKRVLLLFGQSFSAFVSLPGMV